MVLHVYVFQTLPAVLCFRPFFPPFPGEPGATDSLLGDAGGEAGGDASIFLSTADALLFFLPFPFVCASAADASASAIGTRAPSSSLRTERDLTQKNWSGSGHEKLTALRRSGKASIPGHCDLGPTYATFLGAPRRSFMGSEGRHLQADPLGILPRTSSGGGSNRDVSILPSSIFRLLPVPRQIRCPPRR